MRTRLVQRALRDWTSLNEVVADMTLEEARAALEQEQKGEERRESFCERLKQRIAAAMIEDVRQQVEKL